MKCLRYKLQPIFTKEKVENYKNKINVRENSHLDKRINKENKGLRITLSLILLRALLVQ